MSQRKYYSPQKVMVSDLKNERCFVYIHTQYILGITLAYYPHVVPVLVITFLGSSSFVFSVTVLYLSVQLSFMKLNQTPDQ